MRRPRAGWLGMLPVALLALTMLLPFLYMVSTALMGELDVFRYPPALAPARPHPDNFPAALTALPFGRFFLNSAIFATCPTTTQAAKIALFRKKRPNGRAVIVLLIPRFLIVN